MIDWKHIETVFLDMDGTLLDLHFDTYFWREHVPLRFAEKNFISVQEAKDELYSRFRKNEGTMDWYCIDYWTGELGLDIASLKEEVDHLISVHPYVTEFLDAVRSAGKRILLVTNAHGKSLSLKMDRTRLGGHFDELVCAHDLGLPKEDVAFWDKLKQLEAFDTDKTLLVDDSLSVLQSARKYGIKYLLAVLQPNTREPIRVVDDFEAIHRFTEIMPIE